ncbi:MAG: CsbD family protein [Candidatus Binatus sp.]|uniref:CsbD family protein n=1 Tax=Candidatus Binatus sp. TaxID=2811406 RepID=UPI0027286ACA|nr:CsbD family protein [Candidatus Binatus sp.]MDO8434171.1 CsbD family protein [Candidatus Binatus sp.]
MADGKAEEIKGRIKEAAGDLMDNQDLKDSGRLDKASGKIKQAVEKGVDKVKDALKK